MKNLICNCCGKSIENNPEQNADFDNSDRDRGFGTCLSCIEWQEKQFFDNKIDDVTKMFKKEENRKKFVESSRIKQIAFICKMIEKGILTFKI